MEVRGWPAETQQGGSCFDLSQHRTNVPLDTFAPSTFVSSRRPDQVLCVWFGVAESDSSRAGQEVTYVHLRFMQEGT